MSAVALVTGAAGTLGSAVCARLVADGVTVVSAVRDAGRAPAGTLPCVADLRDEDAVAAAVREAAPSPPTVLICAAGGYRGGRVDATSLADLQGQLDLNLATAYAPTRAVLPGMRAAGGGAIVYVGSRIVEKPFAGAVAAIVSKSALHALCRAVAIEERANGIRANIVVPGVIDTPANRESMPDADHDRWVPPARIAGVIAWLASDAAIDTSGAAIPVDGRS